MENSDYTWFFLAKNLPPKSRICFRSVLLNVILLLLLSNVVDSQSVIKALPGFPGNLPFTLETGYIGVGESDEVQLFYYFIGSERNPREDPLMLWLSGGPGCSALSGLLYEIRPITFNYSNSSENEPTLELNPYSWTKMVNIIFLDQPVGTRFSYANTSKAYIMNDTQSTAHTYHFLRKWLINHPKFLENPLYVGADSYCGIVVPIIVNEIYKGNEAGNVPPMNIKGYILGNPFTDQKIDHNSKFNFAHRMALLSDALYESLKANCHGDYYQVDPTNTLCVNDLQLVGECLERICEKHILEPQCEETNSLDLLWSSPQLPKPWCREYEHLYSYIWANQKDVQKALHVREGTITEWVRCNKSISHGTSYTFDVRSTIDYHRNLTNKDCRALIYSGDHDMEVSHVGTEEWINSLNLPIECSWNPWFVEGQVAGFKVKYAKNSYQLTFATVKGGGHTAPTYKPKQCVAMAIRWFADVPL